jgi:aminomethyltransferase
LIEFGGWEMPVQYSGIVDEHLAVRQAAGLFDISHMGQFRVAGPAAQTCLNRILTNDVSKLAVGKGQYTLMCLETGGVVDDLYVFLAEPEEYLLIVNASRIEADFSWMQQQPCMLANSTSVQFRNVSSEWGAVAAQGPRVPEFIDQCFPESAPGVTGPAQPSLMRKNQISRFLAGHTEVWISRTGYTGEDGFEILSPAADIEAIWELICRAGAPYGLKPAGLGARDTLRLEACYPLYGHELDDQTTPIEAGLARFVALEKPDFAGRAALARQASSGVNKCCVAFRMTGKAPPPRAHYPIHSGQGGAQDQVIGYVTSGTASPTLNQGVGMAYIPPNHSRPGTPLAVDIRGRLYPAEVVVKPHYRRMP